MPAAIKQRMRMASSDKKRSGFSEDNSINERALYLKTGSKIEKKTEEKIFYRRDDRYEIQRCGENDYKKPDIEEEIKEE